QPSRASPPAAPASEPSLASPPAAPAGEPSLASPPAAPAGEPSLASPPAAPAGEPSLASPPAAVAAITASNTETTARPSTPVDFTLSPEEAAALLARGDRLLSIGDVTSARLFYERAVDGGAGLAGVRLGETYDPCVLR